MKYKKKLIICQMRTEVDRKIFCACINSNMTFTVYFHPARAAVEFKRNNYRSNCMSKH